MYLFKKGIKDKIISFFQASKNKILPIFQSTRNKLLTIYQSNKKFFIGFSLIAVIVLIVFLMNTFLFKGSSLFYPKALFTLEKNFESTKDDLIACVVERESLKSDIYKLNTSLNDISSRMKLLEEENSNLIQNFNLCQISLNQTKKDLEKIQTGFIQSSEEATKLQSNFDTLAYNSASNICCKRKVDDPALKYFYIKDNMIYCTSLYDETLKTIEFSCPALK